MTNNEFIDKAKQLAAKEIEMATAKVVPENQVYVVWLSKILQNNKALISTDVVDGVYVEVTHNGNKHEMYVDVYTKRSNKAYKLLAI